MHGNAVGDDLAAPGQRRYRGIGTADAAAADDQQQVAGADVDRRNNRCDIAPRCGDGNHINPGGARALRDQVRCHRAAGYVDDTQARPSYFQLLNSRGARDHEVARHHAPPHLDDVAARGDIATGPAHALSRDRFRQHLRHRAC